MNRHPLLTWLHIAMTSVLLMACATTTNVDYNKSYDFSSIHSIQVIAPEQPASRDTRINSPLVSARIKNAITRHLQAQGFSIVDENADATVLYQLDTRGGPGSYGSGVSLGYGHYRRNRAAGIGYSVPGYGADSYEESVLTIDIQDMKSHELLWRGSSARRLFDGMTPEKLDETVNKLVSETLENFPPGKK